VVRFLRSIRRGHDFLTGVVGVGCIVACLAAEFGTWWAVGAAGVFLLVGSWAGY
jgi:hypothetical protein